MPDLTGLHAVFVDDYGITKYCAEDLRETGAEVEDFRTVEQLLDYFKAGKPCDVIFLDCSIKWGFEQKSPEYSTEWIPRSMAERLGLNPSEFVERYKTAPVNEDCIYRGPWITELLREAGFKGMVVLTTVDSPSVLDTLYKYGKTLRGLGIEKVLDMTRESDRDAIISHATLALADKQIREEEPQKPGIKARPDPRTR